MQFKNKCYFLMIIAVVSIGSCFGLEYNISQPEQVDVGEWFDVNVSVHSEEAINFSVYSYVYDGFNCVGQGWTDNKKEISLSADESKDVVLSDLVKYNTEDGYYNLRVRFKFLDGSNITETYNVKVVSEEQFKETYLYGGLVALCIIGAIFAFRYNR